MEGVDNVLLKTVESGENLEKVIASIDNAQLTELLREATKITLRGDANTSTLKEIHRCIVRCRPMITYLPSIFSITRKGNKTQYQEICMGVLSPLTFSLLECVSDRPKRLKTIISWTNEKRNIKSFTLVPYMRYRDKKSVMPIYAIRVITAMLDFVGLTFTDIELPSPNGAIARWLASPDV